MGKSVLIVGGNSFVGSAIARALSAEHTVHCTYHQTYTPIENVKFHLLKEIGDKERCRAIADQVLPEVIIYSIGSNEPSLYESDQLKAQLLMSGGSAAMFTATEVMKPKFIYISSDLVFAGTEGNYAESEIPLAATQLGKAKVGGENYIRVRSQNHVIFRCAPLMGRGPIDHPSWIDHWREALFLEKPIKVAAKILRNPVPLSQLTEAVKQVIQQDIRGKTLHLGGLSKVSMYELATIFAVQSGYNPELISPSDDAQNVHYDFSLNFSESLKTLGTKPLFLEDCFEAIL